jgi:opacity protein-like surface antigen
MKTRALNKQVLAALVLCQAIVLSGVITSSAKANDEQVLKSDPINIEGYMKSEVEVTDRELEYINNELTKQSNEIKLNKKKTKGYEKLQTTTEKLADETEKYIEEKESSQKVIDEYNKKIDCLMNKRNSKECEKYVKNKNNQNTDAVSSQAAATQKVTANAAGSDGKLGMKITPYSGLTSYSTNVGNLESGITGGLRAEMDINERFSFGIGFLYSNLINQQDLMFGGWNFYNNQRDMEYTRYTLEAYSKFYLLRNERFRPYVGAGLSYNRTNMSYRQNMGNAMFNGQLFANEEVTANVMGAQAMIGTEFLFTQSIGVNLEFQYSRALSVNNNTRPNLFYGAGFQDPLVNVSDSINNADAFSLFVGLVIKF